MFRSVGLTFGSKMVAALVNFSMIILLSRMLGAGGKGQCSLYLLIFSTALILSECISGSTVVFLMSKYSYKQLLAVFYAWSLPCAAVGATLFWCTGKIADVEWGWVGILCWLNAATSMNQLIALGKKKLILFNALNLLQAFLTLGAVIISFKVFQPLPVVYLYALCVAWGSTCIIGLLVVYRLPVGKSKAPWKLIIKDGFRAGTANQTATLIQLINTRLSYVLLPAGALGVFSNAVSLCEAALIINSSIGTVQYSRMAAEPGRQYQLRLTHQCFWASAWLMGLALLVLELLPGNFFSWVFGPDFAAVGDSIRLLVPGIFLYSCYIIFSYFFSGTGRFYLNNYPAFVALLITCGGFGAGILLQVPVNVPFVAIVLGCSYTGLFVTAFVLFLKLEKISPGQWIRMPALKSLKDLI